MEWARTLRIDAPANDAVQSRVRAAFARDGVRVSFGPKNSLARTYALVEGPEGSDPSELEQRVPDGRWYEEAIIALAIEPTPADALQHVQNALGGRGGPAGVLGSEIAGSQLVLELLPSVTQPSLVLRIVDVELKRFNGHRRTQLLSALPLEVMARIAAQGLQTPELAADRVLEALLEEAHVE